MTSSGGGLSLHDAARAMGVIFTEEAEPRSKMVNANGLELHYLDWGNPEKPAMLLLHGRTQSAHSWDFTSLAFHENYHVMALDQRGHGDSQWAPEGDYSIDAQVLDIRGFVDALGITQLVVVGHSMGGRNAIAFAGQYPALLSALVVVEMAPAQDRSMSTRIGIWHLLPADADSFEEYVDAAHSVNPRRTKEQLRGSLAHQVRRFPNGKWSWKWDPLMRDADTSGWTTEALWDCASNIRCPTVLIRGAESGMISDETVQQMETIVPGLHSAIVPGAGHLVPGDKPAAFHQVLREFLGSVT